MNVFFRKFTTNSVAFTYDASGNLSTLDPPGSIATAHSFGYDGEDALVSYAPPAISGTTMTTQYQYDRDGQVLKAILELPLSNRTRLASG